MPTPTPTGGGGSLGLSVDPALQIPLLRNVLNSITLAVSITGEGQWHMRMDDTATGPSKGHMTSGIASLARPMTAVVNAGSPFSLEDGGPIGQGTGTTTVPVELRQFVGPADRPGTYHITIKFELIAGF